MTLVQQAQAGTLESSDIMVLIKPLKKGEGRTIEIDSNVKIQYGNSILQTINQMLDHFNIENVHLHVNDKGALTPVIKARIETAIKRALNTAEGTLQEPN